MSRSGMDLVVVGYHSTADLERFVRSYEETQPTELETRLTIVLVEATEDEIDAACQWGYQALPFAENVGYNVACNEAARRTNEDDPYDTIAFFNADTALKDGVLEGCYSHLQAPGTAVVGPMQVDRRGRLTHTGIVGTNRNPILRGWLHFDRREYITTEDVVSVSGSAYFIRRDAFNALSACSIFQKSDPDATGAFLTARHYYGETWISYHARDHGLAVKYVGDVPKMVHEWHKSSPHGGYGEQNQKRDQAKFRQACADHEIECD